MLFGFSNVKSLIVFLPPSGLKKFSHSFIEYIMNFFESAPINPNSITLYNSKLNEWISFMPPIYQSLTCIIQFPTLSMNILNTHLVKNTPTNRHIYIVAILSFLRHYKHLLLHLTPDEFSTLRQTWITINNENEAPIIQRRLENKPTDLQMKKGGVHLSYDDLCLARDELQIGSMERLLFSMYMLIPPVRGGDYHATQFVYDDETPTHNNFIRIRGDSMQSTLTDFKTAKQYKQIVNLFPPELVFEIKTSLEIFPRQFLFVNTRGNPYSRSTFIIWARRLLTKILDVDFTLGFFRHKYVTHFFATHDISTTTDAQIKEISDKMGHSTELFRSYKWIKDGNKEPFILDDDQDDD
jgi:hypothetical protein